VSRAAELERHGNYAEAVASYRESLLHAPHDLGVHVRLGLLLRELGRDDEANRVFAAAMALTAAWREARWGRRQPERAWDVGPGAAKQDA
jgi:Flp pilus assembly protein TadD